LREIHLLQWSLGDLVVHGGFVVVRSTHFSYYLEKGFLERSCRISLDCFDVEFQVGVNEYI